MNQNENVIGHYLNPLQVWALSFGCAFALVLIGGIILCYILTCRAAGTHLGAVTPGFAHDGSGKVIQVISVAVLSPWAFVGFESVSNSSLGFNFSPRKVFGILFAALFTSSLAYILPTFLAAYAQPEGFFLVAGLYQ